MSCVHVRWDAIPPPHHYKERDGCCGQRGVMCFHVHPPVLTAKQERANTITPPLLLHGRALSSTTTPLSISISFSSSSSSSSSTKVGHVPYLVRLWSLSCHHYHCYYNLIIMYRRISVMLTIGRKQHCFRRLCTNYLRRLSSYRVGRYVISRHMQCQGILRHCLIRYVASEWVDLLPH